MSEIFMRAENIQFPYFFRELPISIIEDHIRVDIKTIFIYCRNGFLIYLLENTFISTLVSHMHFLGLLMCTTVLNRMTCGFSTLMSLISLKRFHIALFFDNFLPPTCVADSLLPKTALFWNFTRSYIVLFFLWISLNLNIHHKFSPLALLPIQLITMQDAVC